MLLLIVIFCCFIVIKNDEDDLCKNEYMVQIEPKWFTSVKSQSDRFGLKFKKKIVSNIYLFEADSICNIEEFKKVFTGKVLEVESRECSKLRFSPWINYSPAPPGFIEWILTKRSRPKLEQTWPYYGMDIQEAWSMSLTGQGIVVAVVDSGVDLNHTDLQRNINKALSRSFVEGDTSNGHAVRLPSYPETDDYTSHGTKAAGLIAAEFGNGVCSAGVAFNATLISLKVFNVVEKMPWSGSLFFPDDRITQALEYRRSEIDIYSCSFGISNMFADSTNHIRTVLKEGVNEGRSGKGSIYVFAAGNLGHVYDCNTVPYSNSIYTITIASVGKEGKKPEYAMPCSCVLAATYGEYNTFNGSKQLNTTTLENKCAPFIGTSASTAVASGILALVLQANKNLTWRDVQHIIVRSSSFDRLKPHNSTARNGKGFYYNPFFGFGLMNATAAILLARNWTTVSEQMKYIVVTEKSANAQVFNTTVICPCSRCPRYLEHVTVYIKYSIQESLEKNFQISLRSPTGTRSVLLNTRVKTSNDNQNIVDRFWNFTSVQFWGENAYGTWSLRLKLLGLQKDLSFRSFRFRFTSATFTFFGTASNPFTEDSDNNISGVNLPQDHDCTTDEETDIQRKDVRSRNDVKTLLQDNNYTNLYLYLFIIIISIVCASICLC